LPNIRHALGSYFFNENAAIVIPVIGAAMKNIILPSPISFFIFFKDQIIIICNHFT
jgi:hypothetical protein